MLASSNIRFISCINASARFTLNSALKVVGSTLNWTISCRADSEHGVAVFVVKLVVVVLEVFVGSKVICNVLVRAVVVFSCVVTVEVLVEEELELRVTVDIDVAVAVVSVFVVVDVNVLMNAVFVCVLVWDEVIVDEPVVVVDWVEVSVEVRVVSSVIEAVVVCESDSVDESVEDCEDVWLDVSVQVIVDDSVSVSVEVCVEL